jgi:hypothetical protein
VVNRLALTPAAFVLLCAEAVADLEHHLHAVIVEKEITWGMQLDA